MTIARITLIYEEDNALVEAPNVELKFTQEALDSMSVEVKVAERARPLAMMAMFGLALDALLNHYGNQGIYSPLHSTQPKLGKAIEETVDALVFEVEVLDHVRTIPATEEFLNRLFGRDETVK